jgi:hypothetical protein
MPASTNDEQGENGSDIFIIGGGGKNDSTNDEQGENDSDKQDGGGKNDSTSSTQQQPQLSDDGWAAATNYGEKMLEEAMTTMVNMLDPV